jgi:hypothetical protein
MTTEPKVSLDEAQAIVETKTAPRVTKESIEAKIRETRYFFDGTLTLAVIEMKNGFKAVGKAAPADARNFDPEVGKRFSYEDAFRSLWPHEGYLLCEQLSVAPDPASYQDAVRVA